MFACVTACPPQKKHFTFMDLRDPTGQLAILAYAVRSAKLPYNANLRAEQAIQEYESRALRGKLPKKTCKKLRKRGHPDGDNSSEANDLTKGTVATCSGKSRKRCHLDGDSSGKENNRTKGTVTHKCGTVCTGEFNASGELCKGTATMPDGTMLDGTFENGRLHGENCIQVPPSGAVRKGKFCHGVLMPPPVGHWEMFKQRCAEERTCTTRT